MSLCHYCAKHTFARAFICLILTVHPTFKVLWKKCILKFHFCIKTPFQNVSLLSAICATISSATGGTVTLQTDGYVTTALFSCNLGYALEGETLLTCRNDGSWDFTSPSCGRYSYVYCTLSSRKHAYIILTPSNPTFI